MHTPLPAISLFFFFNDTATTEIYTLSLHDALPISTGTTVPEGNKTKLESLVSFVHSVRKNLSSSTLLSADAPCNILRDRKSTRLNSSHSQISYAVFCLKKKKHKEHTCRVDMTERVD